MASPVEPVIVLYRDDDLLVVRKPTGLPTTAPGGRGCLVQRVQALDPDAPRLHPTSRLDADASGIVTFARTVRANQRVLEARRSGTYFRRYLALAIATPDPTVGRWEHVLAIDARDPRRRVVLDSKAEAKPALHPRVASSRYAVRRIAEGLVLLDVWPETGRTHQIRVQAAAAGCPLAGDVHYGGPRRIGCADGRVLRAARVMLHCAEVRLPLFGREGSRTIVDEPPHDMIRLWSAAGGTTSVWHDADDEQR